MKWILFFALLMFSFFMLFTPRYYSGPKSDHFNGNVFFNPQGPNNNLIDVLKFFLTRKPSPWPPFKALSQTTKPVGRLPKEQTKITFVNHATVLIQWEGLNILTDPIWSERCSPFSWIGPKRAHDPGIRFEDLPPIDIIAISHNHYDHMDLPTLLALQEKFHPKILVGLGNGTYLKSQGIIVEKELDWWEPWLLSDQIITYVPSHHFSARWPWNRDQMLWGGFTFKGKEKLIYFAGDTALEWHFKAMRERIGEPDFACLPIGAYEPWWFMSAVHLSPKTALQAFKELGAKQAMAIHFGTFQLSDEGINDPPNQLKQEMEQINFDQNKFWIPSPGESFEL